LFTKKEGERESKWEIETGKENTKNEREKMEINMDF